MWRGGQNYWTWKVGAAKVCSQPWHQIHGSEGLVTLCEFILSKDPTVHLTELDGHSLFEIFLMGKNWCTSQFLIRNLGGAICIFKRRHFWLISCSVNQCWDGQIQNILTSGRLCFVLIFFYQSWLNVYVELLPFSLWLNTHWLVLKGAAVGTGGWWVPNGREEARDWDAWYCSNGGHCALILPNNQPWRTPQPTSVANKKKNKEFEPFFCWWRSYICSD